MKATRTKLTLDSKVFWDVVDGWALHMGTRGRPRIRPREMTAET